MKLWQANVAVLALLALGWTASPAQAATRYGTFESQRALLFNPFGPFKPTVEQYGSNRPAEPGAPAGQDLQPTIMPQGLSVQPPAITRELATNPNPQTPTLDVVDAPTVFEAPYLHQPADHMQAAFVVKIHPTSKKTVTVQYRTLDGTGRAGIEYKAKTGTLTFEPNRWSQVVLIDILNDDLKVATNKPGPRTFFLEIFNPQHARIGRSRGEAAIAENGKKEVGVTVCNAIPVYEVGVQHAVFTVALNHPSSKPVTVEYKTVNGTAQAGSDFKAVSGKLTFEPDQTLKTVTVTVFDNKGDKAVVEDFFLEIDNPTNAVLLRHRATGEIVEYANR